MIRRGLLIAVVACALTACGSADSGPEPTASPSSSPRVSETPGAAAEVGFGYAQSVAWTPASDAAGELTISVEKVREGEFSDFAGLDGSGITGDNQAFYVDVSIANEGDVDLGGRDVPLYLEDSRGTLSPPWGFATPFKPCASGPLPDPFAPADEVELCLVFFGSPDATFSSVTFQPTTETTAVKWTGEVTVAKAKAKQKPRQKPTKSR